ncbi:hypothetical protein [Amphibacillus xylanus]|nr:hypothetical protein [Amphibacillus xylanus]
MIERYIYAVTQQLPKKLKDEIGIELRSLINDMIDAMDNTLSEEEKIDKVLRELGDPKELANRYKGKERYLIGPNYYDKYIFVVKIVAFAIFIGISISTGLGIIFSSSSITEMIGGYISVLFSGTIQGIAWVTGIFILLEYKDIPVETGFEHDKWEPNQLPELPDQKAVISRSESVFAIMVSTAALSFVFFLPELIGVYYEPGEAVNIISIFNIEVLSSFKLIIFLIFAINILVELIKIIKGKWTVNIAVITSVLNLISAAMFISIIYKANIWNSEVVQKLEQYTTISFERLLFITAAIIIIITISESVTALYKGIKYGGKK